MIINGKKHHSHSQTLAELLQELDIGSALIAVEVNKEIISKTGYSTYTLKESDTIEIIHAIGGG